VSGLESNVASRVPYRYSTVAHRCNLRQYPSLNYGEGCLWPAKEYYTTPTAAAFSGIAPVTITALSDDKVDDPLRNRNTSIFMEVLGFRSATRSKF